MSHSYLHLPLLSPLEGLLMFKQQSRPVRQEAKKASRKLVDQPVLLSELSQSLLFAQFQLADAEGQFLTDLQSSLPLALHTTDGLLHFSRFLFLATWPPISITKFTPLKSYAISSLFERENEYAQKYGIIPLFHFGIEQTSHLFDDDTTLSPTSSYPSTHTTPFHFPDFHPHFNSHQFIKHNILLSNSIYKYLSLEDVLEEPTTLVSNLHNHPRALFSSRHRDFSAIVHSYIPCGFFLLRIWAHIEAIRIKLEQLQNETHKYFKLFPEPPNSPSSTAELNTYLNPIQYLSQPTNHQTQSQSQSSEYNHQQSQCLLHIYQLYYTFNIEFNQVINDIYMWFYRNPVLVQLLEDLAYDFINMYDSFHPLPSTQVTASGSIDIRYNPHFTPSTPVTHTQIDTLASSNSSPNSVRRRTKVSQTLDPIGSQNSQTFIPLSKQHSTNNPSSLQHSLSRNSSHDSNETALNSQPESKSTGNDSFFRSPSSENSLNQDSRRRNYSLSNDPQPSTQSSITHQDLEEPPHTIANISYTFLLAPPSPPPQIAKSSLFLSNLQQLLDKVAEENPKPSSESNEPTPPTLIDFSTEPIFPNLISLNPFITVLFDLQLETFSALLPLHQFWSFFQSHFLASVNHARVFEYLDLNDFFYGLVTSTDPYTNKTSNQNNAIVSYVLQLSRMQHKDKRSKGELVQGGEKRTQDKALVMSQPFDFDKYQFEHTIGGLDLQHWVDVEMELKNEMLSLFYLPTQPPATTPPLSLLQPTRSCVEIDSMDPPQSTSFNTLCSNIQIKTTEFDPYYQTQSFQLTFTPASTSETVQGQPQESLSLTLPDMGASGFYPIPL